MRIRLSRAAVTGTLAVLGVTAGSAAAMPVSAAPAGPQLWVQRYHGPASPANGAAAAVMSPDGKTVFVTGSSLGNAGSAFATIAYRASTGARLWVARYPSGGKSFSGGAARAIALSPDGAMVFVTGFRLAGTSGYTDYATVAYRAATGRQVWAARYGGPAGRMDSAASVAVSPRAGTVFVTGSSQGPGSRHAYATIAYRAATGSRLWLRRFHAPGNSEARALAVSPSGQMIFVTGQSAGRGTRADYLTIAYRAATGTLQWRARYNGPGNRDDSPAAVKVTPDSQTVLVTGTSYGVPAAGAGWATIAYRAATGARRWITRYNGPGNGYDSASALAIGPGGGRVYVTGTSSGRDCTTIAYRTSTGARLWAEHVRGPGNGTDRGNAIATSPDGSKVFITGLISTTAAANGDYLTIGYRAASGGRLWTRHYNGPASSLDEADAIVTSATRVIVTGISYRILGNPGTADYATIAYRP